MPPTTPDPNAPAPAARVRALEDRHAALEERLAREVARPRPDEAEVARLKREKLRLKEEIERLGPRPPS